MQTFADSVVVLWGWRRALVAVLAGAVSALAFAPFDLFPVPWITLPVFVLLIDGATAPADRSWLRRLLPAAVVGWCFGFGFFVGGLWWIGAAFLVDAEVFAWLMPVAVLGFPAFLALFWAFGAVFARLMWSDGWPRLFAFAAAMTAVEWLRGHILTGFPWNAFGYALAPNPLTMQLGSVLGLWGLTLLAFFIFASPVLLFGPASDRRGRLAVLGLAVAVLAGDLAFGAIRLAGAEDRMVEGVRLRLVQAAIDQSTKWEPGSEGPLVERYLGLTRSLPPPGTPIGPTHIVWPESVFPFLLAYRPDVLASIADLLPPGTTLITGAARGEPPTAGEDVGRIYNALYVIDDTGEILAAYDKVHLVPFGEYLPFQPVLESFGLRQLTQVIGGYSPGSRLRTITLADAPPFGPLICYEAIFSGEVTEPGNRPGWLLNVTNDAWYGITPGPHQHLRQAQLRAAEEGLPLIRAANTGISAIIDPYGRLLQSLDLGETGIVDGELPAGLGPTAFARFGGLAFSVLVVLFIITGLWQSIALSLRRPRDRLT